MPDEFKPHMAKGAIYRRWAAPMRAPPIEDFALEAFDDSECDGDPPARNALLRAWAIPEHTPPLLPQYVQGYGDTLAEAVIDCQRKLLRQAGLMAWCGRNTQFVTVEVPTGGEPTHMLFNIGIVRLGNYSQVDDPPAELAEPIQDQGAQ